MLIAIWLKPSLGFAVITLRASASLSQGLRPSLGREIKSLQ
jgi:hypothetical protein